MLGRRALPLGRIATLGARANPDPDHSRVQFAIAHHTQGGTVDVRPVARFQCGRLRDDLAADWKLADPDSEPGLRFLLEREEKGRGQISRRGVGSFEGS